MAGRALGAITGAAIGGWTAQHADWRSWFIGLSFRGSWPPRWRFSRCESRGAAVRCGRFAGRAIPPTGGDALLLRQAVHAARAARRGIRGDRDERHGAIFRALFRRRIPFGNRADRRVARADGHRRHEFGAHHRRLRHRLGRQARPALVRMGTLNSARAGDAAVRDRIVSAHAGPHDGGAAARACRAVHLLHADAGHRAEHGGRDHARLLRLHRRRRLRAGRGRPRADHRGRHQRSGCATQLRCGSILGPLSRRRSATRGRRGPGRRLRSRLRARHSLCDGRGCLAVAVGQPALPAAARALRADLDTVYRPAGPET